MSEARKHAALRGEIDPVNYTPGLGAVMPDKPERREADRRKSDRWTTAQLIAECRRRGIL